MRSTLMFEETSDQAGAILDLHEHIPEPRGIQRVARNAASCQVLTKGSPVSDEQRRRGGPVFAERSSRLYWSVSSSAWAGRQHVLVNWVRG